MSHIHRNPGSRFWIDRKPINARTVKEETMKLIEKDPVVTEIFSTVESKFGLSRTQLRAIIRAGEIAKVSLTYGDDTYLASASSSTATM